MKEKLLVTQKVSNVVKGRKLGEILNGRIK